MRKPISEALEKQIIACFHAGIGQGTMVNKLMCSSHIIRTVLEKHGLKREMKHAIFIRKPNNAVDTRQQREFKGSKL